MTTLPVPIARDVAAAARSAHVPSRPLVVLDPFNLVPDTAVLPEGVALVRRTEPNTEAGSSADAAQLAQALLDQEQEK